MSVDISPLLNAIVPILAAVLTALGSWGIKRWISLTHVQFNRDQEAVIEKALRGAIGFAEEWAYQQAKDRSNVTVRNEMAAVALRYVAQAVPDALKHFGMDDDAQVARLIYSRLPTPAGTIDPATVQVTTAIPTISPMSVVN